jgi:hypothetical protein
MLSAQDNLIYTFANGMIGSVTKRGKIALVNRSGWMTKHGSMPDAQEYIAKHTVLKIEQHVGEKKPLVFIWEQKTGRPMPGLQIEAIEQALAA